MKILMQNRYDYLTKSGGDSYQMLYTKKYLEKEGVSVDISKDLNPELDNYDFVHLFNITRVHETYVQFRNAKKKGKKVVVSPIYHSISDIRNYESKNLSGLPGFLSRILKATDRIQLLKTLYYVHRYPKIYYSWFVQFNTGYTKQQKEILENADLLIPNTQMEIEAIEREIFDGRNLNTRYEVVYNGMNNAEYRESPWILEWLKKNKIENYILCPGRIEPRKNQLKIIRALMNNNIPVVFVGRPNKLHFAYFNAFRKSLNSSNAFYLKEVSQEEIATLYKYAKAAITASWFETTGLVGLEAGIMGCNVIMTEKGYTREIYKDKVWYCNPESEASILDAVISAHSAQRDHKKLSEYIKNNNFSWENSAKKTLKAYEKLFN